MKDLTIKHPISSMGKSTGERGCDPAGTYYEHICDTCGGTAWDDDFVEHLILSSWKWCSE